MKHFKRILSTVLALILLLGTYTPAYAQGASGLDALKGLSFDAAALSKTPRLDLSSLDKLVKNSGSLTDSEKSGQEKELVSRASKLMEDGLKKFKDFQDSKASENPDNSRPAPPPGENKENDVKKDLQALGLDLSFLKDLDIKKLEDWKIPDLKSLDPLADKDADKAEKKDGSGEKKDQTKKDDGKGNPADAKKGALTKEAKEALDRGAKEFAEKVLKDGQAGKVYTLTLDGKTLETQMEYELSRDDDGKPTSITWVYKLYTKEQKPDLYNTFITYPDDGLDKPLLLTEESTKEEKAAQKALTEAREAFRNSDLNQEFLNDYEKSLLLTYDLEHLVSSDQGYSYSKVVTPIQTQKDKNDNDNGGWTLDVQTRLGGASAIQRFRINKEGNLLWPKDGADPKDFAPQMTSKVTDLSRRATVTYANTGNKEISYAPQLDLLSPDKLSQARIEIYDLVQVDEALTQKMGELGRMDLSKLGFDEKDLDRVDLSRLDPSAWDKALKDWSVKDLTRVGIIKDAKDLEAYAKDQDPKKDLQDAQKAVEDLLGPAKIKGAELFNKTADLLFNDNINGYAFRPIAQGQLGDLDPKKPLKLAPGQIAIVSLVELNKEGLEEKKKDLEEKAAEAKAKAEAEAKAKKEAAKKAAAEAKTKAEAEAKVKKEAAEKAAAEAKAKAEEMAKAEKEKAEKAAADAKAAAEEKAAKAKAAAEALAGKSPEEAKEILRQQAKDQADKLKAQTDKLKDQADKLKDQAKKAGQDLQALDPEAAEKAKGLLTPKVGIQKVTTEDIINRMKSAAEARPLPKPEEVKEILKNSLVQAGTALGIEQGTGRRDKLDQLMKEDLQGLARQYAPPLRGPGGKTLEVALYEKGTTIPLAGAEFLIYQPGGIHETLTTGSDGKATKTGLSAGTYYVQQVSAPDGYLPIYSGQALVIKETDVSAGLVFANVKVGGGSNGGSGSCTLTIQVYEDNGGNPDPSKPIKGAVLEITKNGGGFTPLILTTDVNGVATAHLDPGAYTIRQLSSDKDHLPWVLPKTENISATQTTPTLTYSNVKRPDSGNIVGNGGAETLTLLVYDKDDHNKRIADAVLRVVGDGLDVQVTTGPDGTAEVKNLKLGTYTITQLSAPEDYLPYPDPITITKSFFYDPYIVKIDNAYAPQGRQGVTVYVKDFTLDAQGQPLNTPVSKATVQILDKDGKVAGTQTTGEDGVLYFKSLDPSLAPYTFRLVQAPRKYGDPKKYKIIGDGELKATDLEPGKSPWREFRLVKAETQEVRITVFEKGDEKTKISGATFDLISLADGEKISIPASDSNGEISVTVPTGDYKLVQKTTGPDYDPMPGELTFTVLKQSPSNTGNDWPYEVPVPNALKNPQGKMEIITVNKNWQTLPDPAVTAKFKVINLDTGETAKKGDGSPAEDTLSSDAPDQSLTFSLPKYDENYKRLRYSVVEEPLEGYYYSIFQEGLTFTLTNYPDANPDKTTVDIRGHKNWQNDTEAGRPASVTVELLKNGEPFNPRKTQTASKPDWTYEFGSQPAIDPQTRRPNVYSVREVNPPAGYNTVASPVGYDLINVKNGAPTGSFTVKKTDPKGDPLPGASFELRRIKATWTATAGPNGAYVAVNPRVVEKAKTLEVKNADGTLLFDDLQDGLYELEEVKAPVKEITGANGTSTIPYNRDKTIHVVQVKNGFITIDGKSYHSSAAQGSFPVPYTEEINQQKARNPQPFKMEIPEGFLSKRISKLVDDKANKYQMELTVEGKSEFSEGKAVDVVLVVDHSGSIRKNGRDVTVRQQVETLVDKLAGQPNIRLGYVEYSGFSYNKEARAQIRSGRFGGNFTPPNENLNLPGINYSPWTKYPIKEGTSSILSSIPLSRPADITKHTDFDQGEGFNTDHFSNSTFTQEGLKEAKEILDNGRPDAEKKIVLVTDGGPTLSFKATEAKDLPNGVDFPNPGGGSDFTNNAGKYDTYATAFDFNTVVGDGNFYRFRDGYNFQLSYLKYPIYRTSNPSSKAETVYDNAYATMSYVRMLHNQYNIEVSTLAYDLDNTENWGVFNHMEDRILPNLASPGRYKKSQSASDLAKDFETLFHLDENYAYKSIQHGIVEDPMGDHIDLDLGPNGIFNANDYELTASKPELLEGVQVTYDETSKKILLTGLNLKSGEWVRLNYKVSLNENAEKDTFYRTNGPTTLQPKATEPSIKRDFPVPAIQKYEAVFAVENSSPYPFKLSKVDAERDKNGQLIFLSGAEFTLKRENSAGKYEVVPGKERLVSGDGGLIALDQLPLGNYCLEETKAPEGYELPKDPCYRFKVVQNEFNEYVLVPETGTKEVVNYRKYPKGEFELRKLKENKDYLPGATFTLYELVKDANGNVIEEREIQKQVTVADKNLTFKDLKPGEYRLRETEAPGKYIQINGYWDITVDSQGFTQVVGHLPQTYQRQRAALKADPAKPLAKSVQGPTESLAFARKAVPATLPAAGSGALDPAALKASSGRLQMSPPVQGPPLRSVVNEETTVNSNSYDMVSSATLVNAERKEYGIKCKITPKADSNLPDSDFYFAVETSDYADGPNDRNVFQPMLQDFIQKLKDYNQGGRISVWKYQRTENTDQSVPLSNIASYNLPEIINVQENTPKTRTVTRLRGGLNNNDNADPNNRKMGEVLGFINSNIQAPGANPSYVVICSPYDAQKSTSLYPVAKAIRNRNGQIYAYTGIFKERIDNGKFYQNANNAVVNDPGNIIYYSYDDQGNYLMGDPHYVDYNQNSQSFGREKPMGTPKAKDLLDKIFTPDKLVSTVDGATVKVDVPKEFTVVKAEGCTILQNPDGTTTITKTGFTAPINQETSISYNVKLTNLPQNPDTALPVWKTFTLTGSRNDTPFDSSKAPTVKDDGLTITIDSKLIERVGGNETLTNNTTIPLTNVRLYRALLNGQKKLVEIPGGNPFILAAGATNSISGLEPTGLDTDGVRRPYTYTVEADAPKDYVLTFQAADAQGTSQPNGALSGSGTLTICLREVGMSFAVRKIWQTNQTLPDGLTVHLLRRLKGTNEDFVDTGRTLVLTGRDGWQGAFTDLEAVDPNNQPYEYHVREETPEMNDGYYRVTYIYDSDGRGVTIRSEAVPVITVHNYEPNITFLKKDGLSQPLTGGTFVLKKVKEDGTETVVKTISADQGRLVFDHLDPGTKNTAGNEKPAIYKVYETAAPDGFEAPGEGTGKEVASFKIKADGSVFDIQPTSGTILNKHLPVHVYLRKVDKEDTTQPPIPLSGAEFDLYRQKILPLAENLTPNNTTLDIGDMADSSHPDALLKYAGKYNIRDKNGTLVYTFATKKDASGKVIIAGKDGLDEAIQVNGQHISIKKVNPAMGPYRLEVETDEQVNGTFRSGTDGKIDLGSLAPGTYRLFETKAPDGGYQIPPAPVVILVKPDGKVQVAGIDAPATIDQPADIANSKKKTGMLGALKVSRGSGDSVDAVSGATYAVWTTTADLSGTGSIEGVEWKIIDDPHRYVPFEKNNDPNTPESNFYKRYGFLIDMVDKDAAGNTVYYRIEEGRAPMGYSGNPTGWSYVVKMKDPGGTSTRLEVDWIRLYDAQGNFKQKIYDSTTDSNFRDNNNYLYYENNKIHIPSGNVLGLALDLNADTSDRKVELLPSLLVDNQPNQLKLIKYDEEKALQPGHLPADGRLAGAKFAIYYRDDLVGTEFPYSTLDANGNPVTEKVRLSPLVKNPDVQNAYLAPEYGRDMTTKVPAGMTLEEAQYTAVTDANGVVSFKKLPQRFIKYQTVDFKKDWPNTVPAPNVRPHYYLVELEAPEGYDRITEAIGPFLATENGFVTVDSPLTDTAEANDKKTIKAPQKYPENNDSYYAYKIANRKYTVHFRKVFRDYRKTYGTYPMKDITFALYRQDTDGVFKPVKFTSTEPPVPQYGPADVVLTKDNANQYALTGVSDAKGELSFKIPLEGTYAIKEVNTPDYYVKTDFAWKFIVDSKGQARALPEGYVPMEGDFALTRDPNDPPQGPNIAGGISSVNYATGRFTSYFYVNPEKFSLGDARMYIYVPDNLKNQYTVDIFDLPDGAANANGTFPKIPNQALVPAGISDQIDRDTVDNYISILFYRWRFLSYENLMNRRAYVVRVTGPFDAKTDGEVGIEAQLESNNANYYDRDVARIRDYQPLTGRRLDGTGAVNEIINNSIIRFTKVNSENVNEPLAGAVFTLSREIKDPNTGALSWALVTDYPDHPDGEFVTTGSGSLTLERLPEGRYLLKEIKVPEGYFNAMVSREFAVDASGRITVVQPQTEGETFEILKNTPKGKENLQVRKYKEDGVSPLPGARFKLITPYGETEPQAVDGSGVLTFSELPPGTYYIKEVEAPSGYTLDSQAYRVQVNAKKGDYKAPRDQWGNIDKKTNVGQLIEITGMKAKTSEGRTDILYPNRAESLLTQLNIKIRQPKEIKPGDYCVIKLSDTVDTHGIGDSKDDNFDIYAAGGRVAEGIYDRDKNTITYVFTKYLETYRLLSMEPSIQLYPNREVVGQDGTMTYTLALTDDSGRVTYSDAKGQIYVDYHDIFNKYYKNVDGLSLGSFITECRRNLDEHGNVVDPGNPGAFTWIGYVNPERNRYNNSELFFATSTKYDYEHMKVTLYPVPDDMVLPKSYGVKTEDLESPVSLPVGEEGITRNGNRLRINLGDRLKAGKRYVVKITGDLGTANLKRPLKTTGWLQSHYLDGYNQTKTLSVFSSNYSQFYVNRGDADVAVLFFLNNHPNRVELTKIGSDGKPIIESTNVPATEKAQFRLEKQEGTNWVTYRVGTPPADTIGLNSEGKIVYAGLPAGNYRVLETKAPKGYFDPGTNKPVASFTIDRNTGELKDLYPATGLVTNKPRTLSLEKYLVYPSGVTKKAGGNLQAVFSLYKYTGTETNPFANQGTAFNKSGYTRVANPATKDETGIKQGAFLTNENGVLNLTDLENNAFYGLIEDQAPPGFSLLDKGFIRIFRVTESGDIMLYRKLRLDEVKPGEDWNTKPPMLIDRSRPDQETIDFFRINNRHPGYPKTGGLGPSQWLALAGGTLLALSAAAFVAGEIKKRRASSLKGGGR